MPVGVRAQEHAAEAYADHARGTDQSRLAEAQVEVADDGWKGERENHEIHGVETVAQEAARQCDPARVAPGTLGHASHSPIRHVVRSLYRILPSGGS